MVSDIFNGDVCVDRCVSFSVLTTIERPTCARVCFGGTAILFPVISARSSACRGGFYEFFSRYLNIHDHEKKAQLESDWRDGSKH